MKDGVLLTGAGQIGMAIARRVGFDKKILNVYDTYQFNDYSKYDMDLFVENHKEEIRNKQFNIDIENAFKLGKKFAENGVK